MPNNDGDSKQRDDIEGTSKVSIEDEAKEAVTDGKNEKKTIDDPVEKNDGQQYNDDNREQQMTNDCKNCKKKFKTLNAYNKHCKEQTCVDLVAKTYCKLCKTTFGTRDEYETHMMSSEHITQINKGSLRNIINLNDVGGSRQEKKSLDNINKQNIVDPYLSASESISMVNSDNKITIVYKDGRKEDKVIRNDKKKDKKDNNVGIDETQNTSYEPDSRSDCLSPISNVSSTEDMNEQSRYDKVLVSSKEDDEEIKKKRDADAILRRKKIMILLKNIQNEDKAVNKFLKLLNKLNMEDYNGLNTDIIKDKEIRVLPKQKYLQAIKDFIGLLIKKKNEGYNAHNGNDIQQIVTNLTS